VAAHGGYGGFGRDAGPRGAFIKEHGNGLAREGAMEGGGDGGGAFDGGFVRGGGENESAEFVRG